jgi:hypothetical protein
MRSPEFRVVSAYRSRAVYARLFNAMSLEEAKEALGFTSWSNPSPSRLSPEFSRRAYVR